MAGNPVDCMTPDFQLPGVVSSDFVGAGPIGEVYRVHCENGSRLSLKRLNALAIDRERLGRNCRRLLVVPPHPGLVPLIGYQIGGAPYFIAHAWVESDTTLASLAGAVREDEAWPLLLDVAGALAHLHRHGVHHSNLHPANVFVETGAGEIRGRLADVGPGLAGRIHHLEVGESAWFAPPEQLEDPAAWEDGAVERWDVYRFGALAFWLITGALPRGQAAREARDAELAQSAGRPVAVDRLALASAMRREKAVEWPFPSLDRAGELRREVVERCLALDPADRPCDFREVAEAFAAIDRQLASEAAELQWQRTLAEAAEKARQEKARHQARVIRARGLAAAFLAGLLVLSALLVRYFHRSEHYEQRASELDLVVDHQKDQIETLDRRHSQTDHELRSAREAANAVLNQIGSLANGGDDAPLAEGSIEWENLQKTRDYILASLGNAGDDPARRLDRARDLHHLAHVETRLGQSGEADEHLRQAIGLFEAVLAGEAASPRSAVAQECESRLADCHEALIALIGQDPGDEMLHSLREASRYLALLAERRPNDDEVARRRLAIDFRLGRQWTEHRDHETALRLFTSVGSQIDGRLAAEPTATLWREMLAELQYHTALTLSRTGRQRQAAEAYAAALETIGRLTDGLAPTDGQSVRLGTIYTELGEIFAASAAPVGETMQLLNEAQRLLEPVHRRRPDHIETAMALGRAQSRLARIDDADTRWKDRYRMSVEAVEQLEKALASEPGHIEARLALVELRAHHISLLRDQPSAVQRVLEKGVEMAEAVRSDLTAADNGAIARIERENAKERLASLFETYARLADDLGDTERARLCQERAASVRQWLLTQGAAPDSVPPATTL